MSGTYTSLTRNGSRFVNINLVYFGGLLSRVLRMEMGLENLTVSIFFVQKVGNVWISMSHMYALEEHIREPWLLSFNLSWDFWFLSAGAFRNLLSIEDGGQSITDTSEARIQRRLLWKHASWLPWTPSAGFSFLSVNRADADITNYKSRIRGCLWGRIWLQSSFIRVSIRGNVVLDSVVCISSQQASYNSLWEKSKCRFSCWSVVILPLPQILNSSDIRKSSTFLFCVPSTRCFYSCMDEREFKQSCRGSAAHWKCDDNLLRQKNTIRIFVRTSWRTWSGSWKQSLWKCVLVGVTARRNHFHIYKSSN